MNQEDNHPSGSGCGTSGEEQVPSRRRFATAGLAGAGVLLSVASRSALGGWGTCTGSELASGNLSRPGEPNPCGCSPGFWWNANGQKLWGTSPKLSAYGKSLYFNDVFGVVFFKSDRLVKLSDCFTVSTHKVAVDCNSSMPAVAFHAVAALLNAAYYGNRYPVPGMQSPAAVISAFQAAFHGGCSALNTFKDKVDIYGKTTDLWCNGDPE